MAQMRTWQVRLALGAALLALAISAVTIWLAIEQVATNHHQKVTTAALAQTVATARCWDNVLDQAVKHPAAPGTAERAHLISMADFCATLTP